MFKGFTTIKLPEYEIITPQTKKSFTVRSLNVSEEDHLKNSLLTNKRLFDHLNRCIYNSIVQAPPEITNYNDFLKNTTIKDRDAILYGLYHITYGEIRNYDVICGACRNINSVTAKTSDCFSITPYPDNDVLTKVVKVPLTIFNSINVYIKQPSLQNEIDINNQLSGRPGVTDEKMTELLIIDKIEEEIPDSNEPVVYDSLIDILDSYSTLPPMDKRKIFEVYLESFGKYGVDLKTAVICQKCGEKEDININLAGQFFRMVYES